MLPVHDLHSFEIFLVKFAFSVSAQYVIKNLIDLSLAAPLDSNIEKFKYFLEIAFPTSRIDPPDVLVVVNI